MEIKPVMETSWLAQMQPAFEQPYFLALKEFLLKERMTHIIYPPGSLIFNAFNLTPFDKVKVVIIGQDPYHGHGQAHGLCFSVPKGIAQPPSLVNIFKELNSDLGCSIPKHGNLEKWAKQGVLLLNAVLTVRANNASSHQNKGWELFTDFAIQQLNKHKEHLVFLLWGNFARSKASLIDKSKHLILETVHPSPLSAYNGFFGCKHFSKTNSYLKEHNIEPIDWQIE